MQKLTRVGPYTAGECRTIEKHGEDLEVLDTVRISIASWKGGAQRWLSVGILSGPHAGLELFVPVETFTQGHGAQLELPQLELLDPRGMAVVE